MTKQFKCWDNQENKWATIDLNYSSYQYEEPTKITGKMGEMFELHDSSRFAWVESTGFLDKNGKMIFSGDIVHVINNKAHQEFLGRVKWNQQHGGWVYYKIDRNLTSGYVYCGRESRLIPIGNGTLEVLGNIFEDSKFKLNEFKPYKDVIELFKKFKNSL